MISTSSGVTGAIKISIALASKGFDPRPWKLVAQSSLRSDSKLSPGVLRASSNGVDALGLDAPEVDAPGVDAPGVDADADASGVDAGLADVEVELVVVPDAGFDVLLAERLGGTVFDADAAADDADAARGGALAVAAAGFTTRRTTLGLANAIFAA